MDYELVELPEIEWPEELNEQLLNEYIDSDLDVVDYIEHNKELRHGDELL